MSSDESLGGVGLPPPPPSWEENSSAPKLVRVPEDTGSLAAVSAAIAEEEEEEPVDELWADAKLEPMEIGESEKMWAQNTQSVVAPTPELAVPDDVSTGPLPIADPNPIPPAVPTSRDAGTEAPKSKLPLILGGAGLAAGLAALIVVLARNGSEPEPEPQKEAVAVEEPEAPTPTPTPSPEAANDDLAGRAKAAIEDGDTAKGMELANELLAQDEDGNAQAFIELACLAEEGVEARKVFRPLKGPKTRARLADECETHGVDLYFKGEGATATEYFRQAERAFDGEDWEAAYRLARSSSRVESSAKAIRIMALSSCHKDDKPEAKRLLKMLLPSAQTEVEDACGF